MTFTRTDSSWDRKNSDSRLGLSNPGDELFTIFFHQVAVIAGNLELAEMIQNYKSEDIGKQIYCLLIII